MKNQYSGLAVINATTDDIRTSLHTSAYVPAQDTDDFFIDCSNQIVGTGYSAWGFDHATGTVTYDTATDQIRFDVDDAIWTTASFTAAIAVVYKNNVFTATTSPLLIYVDFGGNETVATGTFTITWDATGYAVIDIT
jgi:hypothetical protein